MISPIRLLLGVLLLAAGVAFAGPAPLPAPDLSTVDFRLGPDPAPIPAVIGLGATGRIYVAGQFSSVSGQSRPGLARLNADGTLDTAWNPSLPSVSSLTEAAEDASGNVALAAKWAAGNPYTEALVYVPASSMAGQLVAFEPNYTFAFQQLRFDGPDLYAVVQQDSFGNGAAARLRRYLGGTTLDTAFSVVLDAYQTSCSFVPSSARIAAFDLQGDFVYVAYHRGAFRAAKANGARDPAWNPFNELPSGTSPTTQPAAKLTCFPPTPPYGTAISASPDGWIYVAGLFNFTPYRGAGELGIRRFAAGDGSRDLAWDVPNATASTFAHDISAGHLYVEGAFSLVGRGGVAAISTAPGAAVIAGWEPRIDPSATPPSPFRRMSLVVLADRLLVAGAFAAVSDAARANVAALPLASEPLTAPAITITPRVLDFGLSKTGGTRTRTATVRNDGVGNLVIGSIAPAGTSPVQVTHDCAAPLPPGGTCKITATLDMAGLPVVSTDVVVQSNGSAFRQALRLRAGMGDAFQLLGNPIVDFGPFTKIGTSVSRTVTVRNTGGSTLTLEGPFVSPPTEFTVSNACNGPLAAGASCAFTLTYTPTRPGRAAHAIYMAADASGQSGEPYAGTAFLFPYANAGYLEDDYDADGTPNGSDQNPYTKDNDIFAANTAGARRFAMQQYRDFLGREGDASGIQFWTDRILGGASSRAAVIESFLRSAEFEGMRAPVARLYLAYFLRVADYDGLTFWTGYLRAGSTLAAISGAFAASQEFQDRYGALDNGQFVTLLYQNVLGRVPDASGYAYWKGRLDGGGDTRGQVMLGFSESPEFQALTSESVYVTMTYAGMLQRTPDRDGYTYWVQYMKNGNSGQALVNNFLGTPEYRARFLP